MARMHTKGHGKSKSRKPMVQDIAEAEQPMPKEEIEALIVQYKRQGMNQARIGEALKREHSVMYPKHAIGKRITTLLKEKKIADEMPEDLLNLMAKAVNLNRHLNSNKQDKSNALNLRRTESKIWRLTKYYIRKGTLPAGWRYNAEQAELIIRGRS